jgi:diacylglycerol kinase (ATP)
MTAKVILNPYSNRWNSQKRWAEADAALKAAGVDFELVVSKNKGQIVELAAQAVRESCSPIIIAGGDGSIGDAANGLVQAAKSTQERLGPLGIMPTGSANDIAFAVGLPTDLNEAAKVIAAGKTKAMDLGKLNDRYFVNNSAAGLEPYVTIKHEKIQWIKGMARYLVAAVQAIMDKPEWY